MKRTNISWTDAVWNPVSGCTKVSAGCKSCYAEALAHRFWGDRAFTDVLQHPERLDEPLHWRKPRRVFVNSMSDLFHERVSDDFLRRVFAVMALAPHHTFQILTKRPDRMRDFVNANTVPDCLLAADESRARGVFDTEPRCSLWARAKLQSCTTLPPWPLPNVWLGVSVEDQDACDKRIWPLLQTPAALRFVSCEPLLGPVQFCWGCPGCTTGDCWCLTRDGAGIAWVIAGGESGHGFRPMQLAWAQSLREQCEGARVPFFFKQDSGRRAGTRPDALGSIVQQFPQEATSGK